MIVPYDPTGKEHVFSTLETDKHTYKLTMKTKDPLPYIAVYLYRGETYLGHVEMDCQEGLVTKELWDLFVKNLKAMLAKENVIMPEKSLMEKLWGLITQIKLAVTDDHLSADIPEHFEE